MPMYLIKYKTPYETELEDALNLETGMSIIGLKVTEILSVELNPDYNEQHN